MTIKPKKGSGGVEVLVEYLLHMTFGQKMPYAKIRRELKEVNK